MRRYLLAERSIVSALLVGFCTARDLVVYRLAASSFIDDPMRVLFVAVRSLVELDVEPTNAAIISVVRALAGAGAPAFEQDLERELEQLRREGALELERIREVEDGPCVHDDCGSHAVISGVCCSCERPQWRALADLAFVQHEDRRRVA